MRTHPVVLVDAEDAEAAKGQALSFLQAYTLLHGQNVYVEGCLPELENKHFCLQSGTDIFRETIRTAFKNEKDTALQYWQHIRQAVLSLGEADSVPDIDDTFMVMYRLGRGVAGLAEAGQEMCHETTFKDALWNASKLRNLLNFVEGRSLADATVDARVYDYRENRKRDPLQLSKTDHVFGVLLDLRF
jgi:hypothetical protein